MALTQQVDLILEDGGTLTFYGAVQVAEDAIDNLKVTGIMVYAPVEQPASAVKPDIASKKK